MKKWGTSRTLALSIVTFGLLTFFYPAITTDPPVAGISRWSPFEIVRQSYNDALPRRVGCEGCSEPIARVVFALPFFADLNYLFFLAAAGTLFLARQGYPLMFFAFLGGDNCLRCLRSVTTSDFRATFFRQPGQVHYASFVATQFVVMVALFLVGMDLRDEKSSPRPIGIHDVADPPERQVIDAEIVPEDENHMDAPHNPPSLRE